MSNPANNLQLTNQVQFSILQQAAHLNPVFKGKGVSSASTWVFEKVFNEIKLIKPKPK